MRGEDHTISSGQAESQSRRQQSRHLTIFCPPTLGFEAEGVGGARMAVAMAHPSAHFGAGRSQVPVDSLAAGSWQLTLGPPGFHTSL